MDDDLRNAFATLSAQISVVATDLRANTSLTADLSRKVSDVATEQQAQAGRIHVIERNIFGSNPPPAPPMRPLAHSIGEHDGDIASLTGQLIAVASKVEAIEAKTDKQTEKLGLEPKSGTLAFIRNANTKDVVKILTMIAAIIAAWKGIR
jgi:hypothetical protein